MLERIILKVLNQNGLSISDPIKNDFFTSTYFTYRKEDKKIEYYLIATIDQEKFLTIDQGVFSSLNKQIKDLFYSAETAKNTALVICVVKNNELDKDLLERTELQCEENPYFFKKYVLSFDKEVANKVFSSFSKQESSITQYIESIIIDPTEFEKYKFNIENNAEYQLLSKLIMKIPIIPIKMPDISTVASLSEMIREDVEKSKLQRAQELINSMTQNEKKGEEETLDKIITNWKQG